MRCERSGRERLILPSCNDCDMCFSTMSDFFTFRSHFSHSHYVSTRFTFYTLSKVWKSHTEFDAVKMQNVIDGAYQVAG